MLVYLGIVLDNNDQKAPLFLELETPPHKTDPQKMNWVKGTLTTQQDEKIRFVCIIQAVWQGRQAG